MRRGLRLLLDGGELVSRIEPDFRKDRMQGLLLGVLVVLVQVAWGGVLVYLGVRYL